MIKAIVKIYLLALAIFSIFRLLILFSNRDYWEGISSVLLQSLWMGIRFDTVITSYILALPILFWLIFYIIGRKTIILNKFLFWYIFLLFSIAFAICAIDIPYFKQFFSRLDKSAFLWMDNPAFIAEMVFKDFSLWGYFLPFLLIIWLFFYVLKKIFTALNHAEISTKKIGVKVGISVIILGLVFLGIRGRIELKSPIRVGTAYFSDNAFFNKVGLNPNFTLLQSVLKKKVVWTDLMSTEKAFSIVRKDLAIPTDAENPYSIKKKITPAETNFGKPNFIIVLMESMTADHMKYFGNQGNLTPVLDDLVQQSIFFKNAYSEGIHTFNGIYGTITSFPSLWNEHSMKNMKTYYGFTDVLKKEGYFTGFFTTHDAQFDNIEGFLHANNFQKVYSQKDYPSSEIHSNLGVSDHYLFSFALEKINASYQNKQPFFYALLTSSNHQPYIIPDFFRSDKKSNEEKAVQYADWCIGRFIQEAKKQVWFNNTIFVFVADHGAGTDLTYEMSLSYNHIPLFFYAPGLFQSPEIRKDFVKQNDIIPSLLGLTEISYVKNNFGINFWQEERPFAYFSADDKIGVINNDFFLIHRKDGHDALYKYRQKDNKNYATQYPQVVSQMKNYAFSQLQAAHVVKSKLQ